MPRKEDLRPGARVHEGTSLIAGSERQRKQ
jgi:hypothetical protein